MSATKHVNNLYSFSFMIKNVEFGVYLKRVIVHKDVTKSKFVIDRYVFDIKAAELFEHVLSDVEIKLFHNINKNYKPIYKIKGMISKVVTKDNEVVVFIETIQKISWLRKNGISYTAEHSTLDSTFKKYVKQIDSYYKHKTPTKVVYNYDKNINKFKYENMLFPIKSNHFNVAESILKTYFILNTPFYFFLDDYNFTDIQHPVTINFYDLTKIKSLRAVMFKDLNSTQKPIFHGSGTYYNSNVFFNVDKMQKMYDLPSKKFSNLKNKESWKSENKFMYVSEPDSEANAKQRATHMKNFYKKAVKYHKFALTDIDITKFTIGNRFVDFHPNAKYQYSQAIIEAEFKFYTVDTTDIIKNNKKYSTAMMVAVNMTTISY